MFQIETMDREDKFQNRADDETLHKQEATGDDVVDGFTGDQEFLQHKPPVIPCTSIFKGSEEIYPMERRPRGTCLIINVMVFKRSTPRPGSIYDARRLKHVFKAFHFDVTIRHDLTAEAMRNQLKEIARDDAKNDSSDAFVLIILTHGLQDCILGTDDKTLRYSEILKIFSNSNCKSLRGKPKIGFFQACQGGGTSTAQYVSDNDDLPALLEADLVEPADSEDKFRTRSKRAFPPESDFLFSFAAHDSYTSTKYKGQIGYYATILADVLAANAHNTHLAEMLLMVERELRVIISACKDGVEHCLSSSTKTYGWEKNLYFNPSKEGYTKFEDDGQLPETSFFDIPMDDANDDVSMPCGIANRNEKTQSLWIIGGGLKPETLSPDGTQWIEQPQSHLDSKHLPVCNKMKQYLVYNEYGISEWKPTPNRVTKPTKFPEPRDLFSTALLNNKVYLIGGELNAKPTDYCSVYDCTLKRWEENVKLPCEAIGRTAVVFRDQIFLTPGKRGKPLGKLISFSPSGEEWTDVTVRKLKRYGHAVAACDKYIWFFGGSNGTSVLKDVERFCPGTGKFETMKSMLTARMDFSVAFYEGKFYATGGTGAKERVLDLCEVYDPEENKWEPGPTLNRTRSGHGSIVVQEGSKRPSAEDKNDIPKKSAKI